MAALTNRLSSSSLPLPDHLFPKSIDDFDICKRARSRLATGDYESLDDSKVLSTCNLANWETLVLRFKDESGEPLPIEYTPASIEYEDDEPMVVDAEASEKSRGKRKAD